MERIWISAGHQENTGANGYIKEGVEAIYMRDGIVSHIRQKAPNLMLKTDEDRDGLESTIRRMREYKPDVSIDIHFNAFSKETATGSEIYIGDENSRELAGKIVSVVADTLGIKNRGIKTESSSQHNRLGMLHGAQDAKLMLLEVCFVTNKNDSDRYMAKRDILAEKIADVILAYFMQE